MAKRKLNESELRLLRSMAARADVGYNRYAEDSTWKFLIKRGLVRVGKEFYARYYITEEGMAEVVRSGQTASWNASKILDRWVAFYKKAGPILYNMAIRVVGLQQWMDPGRPWEAVANLVYLKMADDLWRNNAKEDAWRILSRAESWLELELQGDPIADSRFDDLMRTVEGYEQKKA